MALAGVPVAAESANPVVVLILGGDQEAAAAPVIDAIEAQFSDLSVELRVERLPSLPVSLREQTDIAKRVGGTPGAACVFWFDLAEDGAVYVHLRGGAGTGDRLLVRGLEPGPEVDRGRAEGLAIIVRSSVAALLRGGRIGILVDEIPDATPPAPMGTAAPPPAPVAPAVDAGPVVARRGPDRLALNLGYLYTGRAGTHPLQHGLWLGLGMRVAAGLHVEAGYAVLEPLAARGELASMRLRRHPARLGLSYMLRLGRTRLGSGVHLVVEHARQELTGLASGMRAAEDLDDVTLAVSPHLSVSIDIWKQLGAFVTAGVDLVLSPLAYTATRGGRREELIGVWPVQPFAMAGLRITLW
jgi:hypothetical protein